MLQDRFPELQRLARIGRTRLANTPTPLLRAPALSARLGRGVEISVKADAWTGLGLGGNKVRKVEYELDPARLTGVTHLITAGGPHSNHCRVTAAAAAHLGLGCSLVINGEPEDPARGNPRLHRLLGARIVTIADAADRTRCMAEEARRIDSAGGKALVIPIGASTARGALGYVHSLVEIHDQYHEASGPDAAPPWIFVSSSSGGTLAGLIVGRAILGWRASLVGVSPDESAPTIRRKATELAEAAADLLENTGAERRPGSLRLTERVKEMGQAVLATSDFVGPGYGHDTPAGEEAIALFGALAGVILDPVYTGKTAAAMIAWIREGRVPKGAHAILLHTGGHPALFR
ncbi:MAG: pyridoxal-phosphate dependent enzyme [Gemmatimonadetes bacterium]|nr:pyridoxal-phosphate dependent enzyme [Gemmatimonadota bacterium]MYC91169.1 pyridoxal-phosphate dependent enzyme [Gemmatimonadota bacterium]MYG35053.1 pyridoxal-phosphate dependent enzyme [Gemmatimonadota bacterium]